MTTDAAEPHAPASSSSTRPPSRRRDPSPGKAGRPIVDLAKQHTTVSVERATLRLAGLGGADPDGTPWVNRLARRRPRRRRPRARRRRCRSGTRCCAARPTTSPCWPRRPRPARCASGSPRAATPTRARAASAQGRSAAGIRRIDQRRRERERLIAKVGDAPRKPWIYLIVATGDIYEDIPQAQAAAREGADVIAVIRSTGQSLLDFVPEGATREGFAGTYATQENFRLMRAALDETSRGARPLRPAHQLRLRPVHARDRHPGRPRAARHDAQRLDVRDPLPRHQPDPHLRRPAVQPPGPRPRRDHHQHRRGQLPHHRRRRRGRAHGHHQPAAQRVLRQGGRARGLAARPRPRVRDRPRRAGLVPARARARDAGPRPVPRRRR